MSEYLHSVWRDQPAEEAEMSLVSFVDRRTQELRSRTKGEVLASIAAVLFFFGVMIWRLPVHRDWLLMSGLAMTITWVLISAYWFRERLFDRGAADPDALADTGVEFYRRELRQRRDHLRNAWVWQGPVILASLGFVAVFTGRSFPDVGRLLNAVPLLLALLAWIAIGIRIRHRQAREIQREVDELESLRQA